MLNLKLKKLSEDELVSRIKKCLDACDADELKMMKFSGLLNDMIPDEHGLKLRLVTLAKNGYVPQLEKLKMSDQPTSKLEKLATQFSKSTGFSYEASYETFRLMAKAMQFKSERIAAVSETPTLRIVPPMGGNFSQKHFGEGTLQMNTPVLAQETTAKPMASDSNGKLKKRRIRNKLNLWAYLIWLIVVPVAASILYFEYGQWNAFIAFGMKAYRDLNLSNPWIAAIGVGITLSTLLPISVNWISKKNLISFYPMLLLGWEMVLFTMGQKGDVDYMGMQLATGLVLFVSFALLGATAYRLPKGAYEYTAYRALVPYYLSAVVWLGGQFIFYARLI